MMKKISVVLILAGLSAGCSQTRTAEPPAGSLPFGQTVLVDDGSCPEGQIKQVTGGNGSTIPRKRECIARPS